MISFLEAAAMAPAKPLEVRARIQVAKFALDPGDVVDALGLRKLEDLADLNGEKQLAALIGQGLRPYDVLERDHNLLMYGGISVLWQALLGNGTTTAGQALTYFNNAQAAIGVGDSTTAAAATQTDLQAATNKLRVAMDSTYPQHTDATTSGAATITFKSTFSTSQANFAWQEWIIANSATAATGRALNRKVESLGTKTSSASWAFTVTCAIA